ncbi:hypothetical protein PsorP6_018647 [Peronosclerospora sorghi]|nr:hypothetical protein PsorP6_018647 [Peronosclerospora sorghi]
MMEFVRGIQQVGSTSMRRLMQTRNALHLTATLAIRSDNVMTRVRGQTLRYVYKGNETNQCHHRELLLVGTVMTTLAALTSREAMCEVHTEEEESVRRVIAPCNGTDHLSRYFDTEYESQKVLGYGSFGVVMQCVHKQTGRVAAVKMIQDSAGNFEEVKREKQALERLKRAGGHASIVGYEGSYYHNDFHYIVMEYVPGVSLYSFIEKHRTLDATLALQLVSQLSSALQFMHKADVVHRDLKPENIMALVPRHEMNNGNEPQNEDITLKIIDLGSVGWASMPESIDNSSTTTLSGTRCYLSPEVLQYQDMTTAMDMWALGCILYILISGRHPFDLTGASTEDEILQRVMTEAVSFVAPVWQNVATETKELIRGLLEKDPHCRLAADQVLEHPAIVGAETIASNRTLSERRKR